MKRLFLNTAIVLGFIVYPALISCSRDSTRPEDNPPPPNPGDIEWIKTKGPDSGPVLSLAIDTLLNHIFAGTEGAGVFKSTDNGETWISFNNGLGGDVVYDLKIDENNRIYAALSQAGLFRSDLSADNWANISPRDTTVWKVAINSGGHIFAATTAGMYRSTDDAASWLPANNGLLDSVALSLALNPGDDLFAGTYTKGLFFSDDNGDTWSQTALSAGTILSLGVSADNHVYVGYLGAGMYYSPDGGLSWASPANGFSLTIVYDYAINSDGYVFAGGDGGGVLRSTDKGVNWEAKNSGLTSLTINALELDRDERLYAGSDSGYVYYTFNPTTIPPIDPGGN